MRSTKSMGKLEITGLVIAFLILLYLLASATCGFAPKNAARSFDPGYVRLTYNKQSKEKQ